MPTLEHVYASNTSSLDALSTASRSEGWVPTMVVFGGTSGIGQAVARRFVEGLGGRVKLVVVGRRRARGERLFGILPEGPRRVYVDLDDEESPAEVSREDGQGCSYTFLACDISLPSVLNRACAWLRERYKRVNFLMLTAGPAFSVGERKVNEEGVEERLGTWVYWRFAVLGGLMCVSSSLLSVCES